MRQIAYVMIGVLVGFILAGSVFLVTRLPAGEPIALEPAPTKVPIEVHVVGGVVHPGIYNLPQGSRVQDAIDAAGGLLSDADPSTINLAAKLEDGQQLQIPGGTTGVEGANTPGVQGGAPFTVIQTPTGATAECNPDLLDINSATLDDLTGLGLNETRAQAIIDNAPYSRIEDISPLIGAVSFESIRAEITVCPP